MDTNLILNFIIKQCLSIDGSLKNRIMDFLLSPPVLVSNKDVNIIFKTLQISKVQNIIQVQLIQWTAEMQGRYNSSIDKWSSFIQ